MKILIVGAGVIGSSIAYQLTRRGHQVTILEAQGIAAGASGRSFGWLNASYYLSPAHYRLRLAGMEAHRRLGPLLPESPIRWPGALSFEMQGEAQAAYAEDLRALGYAVETWDQDRVRAQLPYLSAPPQDGLYFPAEGVADPADLAQRLIAASGAQLWRGVAVRRVIEAQGRITGVLTDQGEVQADAVVLAAGNASPDLVEPLGVNLPMLRRPGVILKTKPQKPLLPVILWGLGGEVRQDLIGRLIMPTAANHQADDVENIAGLVSFHADAATARLRQLLPEVEGDWEEVALAYRPVPGDGLPVIGEARPGLWLAVMHSGATLAAITGELVAQEMDGEVSLDLTDFRPGRFG